RKHFSLRDNPAGLASSIAPGLDPMARRVRKIRESSGLKFAKDLLYFGIVVASLPFTLFEAACGAGSTIMVEGRKKALIIKTSMLVSRAFAGVTFCTSNRLSIIHSPALSAAFLTTPE